MSHFVVTSVLIKSAVGKGPIQRANAAGEADGDAVEKFVNDKYKYTTGCYPAFAAIATKLSVTVYFDSLISTRVVAY